MEPRQARHERRRVHALRHIGRWVPVRAHLIVEHTNALGAAVWNLRDYIPVQAARWEGPRV